MRYRTVSPAVVVAFALNCGGRSALDALGHAPPVTVGDKSIGAPPGESPFSSGGVASSSGGGGGSDHGSGAAGGALGGSSGSGAMRNGGDSGAPPPSCSSNAPRCGDGQHCVDGACICDAASCTGCCFQGECLDGTTTASCGITGGRCLACPADDACVAGVCSVVVPAAKVVLFGGTGIGYPSDTWMFDGATWTQLDVSGPPGRYSAAFATLRGGSGKVVLYGGLGETGFLSDTWTFDGATWTQITTRGPPPGNTAMSALGDNVVLVGRGGVTWIFDGASWTQVDSTPAPSGTFGWSMAPLGNEAVLFGGTGDDSGGIGNTWMFDGTSWTQVGGTGPSARAAAAMATFGKSLDVLFGGVSGSATPLGDLGDTWTFDGATWTPIAATSAGPERRFGAAMASLGEASRKVVLFGGMTASGGGTNETWTFDGTTWTQITTPGPAGRYNASMATLP